MRERKKERESVWGGGAEGQGQSSIPTSGGARSPMWDPMTVRS